MGMKNANATLLARANGSIIWKPERADYSSDLEFVRAYHEYRDEIAHAANTEFDTAFRAAVSK
jgi:hypothetical protein